MEDELVEESRGKERRDPSCTIRRWLRIAKDVSECLQ